MKKLIARFKKHPWHILLGFVLICLGINLVAHDHYFFWPPNMVELVNSDCLGTWAIFTGLGVLYIGLEIKINPDLVWLLSAAGFFGFEVVMEFMHAMIGHGPHTLGLFFAVLGYLFFVFILVRISSGQKRKERR